MPFFTVYGRLPKKAIVVSFPLSVRAGQASEGNDSGCRRGKSGYLKDMPGVFQYMLVCGYLKKPVISVCEKWKFNAISHGLWQIAEESYRGFVATFSTSGAGG